MLGYEWGNHSPPPAPPPPPPPPQIIITDDLHHDPSSHHHHRPIFDDHFSTPCTFPHDNNQHPSPPSSSPFSLFNFHSSAPPHFPLYDTDPRAFPCVSPSPSAMLPLPPQFPTQTTLHSPAFSLLVPKPEPEYPNRIGLDLGGRTYFASDDDLVSRLYRRSRGADHPVNTPKCQAEGCSADLTHAKHYHRRHKVCEFHSKAATVVVAGLTQRFCQQCSRFHLLSEFDNGKRSCRKRLADHNRRRRKSHQAANRDLRESLSQPDVTKSPSQSIQRSTSDSGANSSSSVTVAISSPLASFDSNFGQRSYD